MKRRSMQQRVADRFEEYKKKKDQAYDWMNLVERLHLKPLIELDEPTGKYVCNDKALEKFLQIATNGEFKWIRSFFHRSGRFRINILRDYDGRIRMFLLAYALERGLGGDMDWAKFSLDLIDRLDKMYEKKYSAKVAKAKARRGRAKEKVSIDQRALADLQRMGDESEESETEDGN